ncbi:MAG: acido-empty-quinoprotein group A, partial [Catenulispora sp.]
MSRRMSVVVLIPLGLAGALAQSPSGVQGLTPVGESWGTYHGDHSGRHFSSLKQITTQNVRGL